MNEVQIFNNEEFGQVRIVEIEGKPYFVGKDVATALGYRNTRDALSKHVDGEDKADVAINSNMRGFEIWYCLIDRHSY